MKKAIVLALAGVMLFVTAATASAGHVTPYVELITKSDAGGWSCDGGIKVDPVETGWYGGVYVEVDGDTFSFSTDGVLVDSVIVKGGKNANLYIYSPSTRGDNGLYAPLNTKNGKFYGLSHLCFMTTTKGKGGPGKNT